MTLKNNLSLKGWGEILAVLIIAIFSSCSSSKNLNKTDYQALAQASRRLGVEISRNDNHALMIEASKWIGVPYRYGGKSLRGTDCSGLTAGIYKNAFGITLSSNSQMQLNDDVRKKVKKRDVKQGDLLFFSAKKSKRKINHVGIYLKDGKFVHASTSKGVRVDQLLSGYWKEKWICAGRILKD